MRRIRATAAGKILGVSPSTIRHWDRRGILKADFVSPSGQRFFDEDRIREIAKAGRLSPPEDKDAAPRATAA